MIARYFLPSAVWCVLMWLLFLTPVATPVHTFAGGIPARSLIHGFLFLGFSHLLLGGIKKQLKYEILRRKAFKVVAIAALGTMALSEIIVYALGLNVGITVWNLAFDFIGSILGIGLFRVLYHKCY